MDRFILSLDQIGPADSALVGGKAARLAQLRQAGLPVPDGFVITTQAQQAVLAAGNARLPAALREQLLTAYAGLGHAVPVAVRSSALAEDLSSASFAGQYTTFLNVHGPEALVQRVLDCWASLADERVAHYQRMRGMEQAQHMAVLVQRMVPAQAAGVLFTLDPLSGREEQMVIEASWGLGEALVSGSVSPDRYAIDRHARRIVNQALGDKRLQVQPAGQGTLELETPPELRLAAVLDERQILELAALGEQIQLLFGEPQDIEWAIHDGRVFLLQARPLTAYRFSDELGQWTSANFREVMPGIATPLSFSLSFEHDYVRGLTEVFRRVGLARGQQKVTEARLFFGRPYWRVDTMKDLMRQLPGFSERAFDETIGIETTYEGEGAVTPINLRTIMHGLPVLLRIWWYYLTYAGQAARYKQRFLQHAAALRKVEVARFADGELRDWLRQMLELRWQTNRVALFCSSFSQQAQDDFHAILKPLNAGLPPEDQISEGRLMTGLSGISTARPMTVLWEIVRAAQRYPGVAEVIKDHSPQQMREALLRTAGGRAFWYGLFEGYIQRFHYLAPQDEDLSVPRWDEDPGVPLALLHSFMEAGTTVDPGARAAEQQRVRRAEERRAWRLILRRPLFIVRLFTQLAIVRRYVWWREASRDMLGMAHAFCRRALVEQGRRWAGSYLEQPDDIFWLYRDELLQALAGNLASDQARRLVSQRRITAQSYRHFEPPPIITSGIRTAQPVLPGERTLQGIACSPGVVEGRARIITSLDEAGRLQPGEILVAPYTNPGWTPLFSLAGAVVMEEGGLLSHGAVVARECGVPTVLQVRDATRLIRDQQMIRVDGAQGLVELLEEASAVNGDGSS